MLFLAATFSTLVLIVYVIFTGVNTYISIQAVLMLCYICRNNFTHSSWNTNSEKRSKNPNKEEEKLIQEQLINYIKQKQAVEKISKFQQRVSLLENENIYV